MTGRVCVVTGANSGIGKATAAALGKMGERTVLVCRDRERGQAAAKQIEAHGPVELVLADLASQASIRELADELSSRFDPLDVLVNNAGVALRTRTLTTDGFEATFAINHLAPFLLTNLLLDVLKRSAPSRIVTVASDAHRPARIDFDDLQGERRYGPIRAYNQSKLANIMFTYELARRLDGTGVTANCVHPGFVRTNLGRESLLGRLISTLAGPFARTPEKGAETSVHVATAPELEGVNGKYFANRRETKSSDASYDEVVARRLWEVSAQMTGLTL